MTSYIRPEYEQRLLGTSTEIRPEQVSVVEMAAGSAPSRREKPRRTEIPPVTPLPVAVMLPLPDPMVSLQAEVAKLKANLENATRKNVEDAAASQVTMVQLQDAARDATEKYSKAALLRQQLQEKHDADVVAARKPLEDQISALKAQVGKLEEKQDADVRSAVVERTAGLNTDLKKLQQELDELRLELADKERAIDAMHKLRETMDAEIVGLKAQILDNSKMVETLRAAQESDRVSKDRIVALEMEVAKLSYDNAAALAEAASARELAKGVPQETKTLKDSISKLSGESAAKDSTILGKQEQIVRLMAANEKVSTAFHELDSKHKAAMQRIEVLEKQITELGERLRNAEESRDKMRADQDAAAARLEKKVTALDEHLELVRQEEQRVAKDRSDATERAAVSAQAQAGEMTKQRDLLAGVVAEREKFQKLAEERFAAASEFKAALEKEKIRSRELEKQLAETRQLEETMRSDASMFMTASSGSLPRVEEEEEEKEEEGEKEKEKEKEEEGQGEESVAIEGATALQNFETISRTADVVAFVASVDPSSLKITRGTAAKTVLTKDGDTLEVIKVQKTWGLLQLPRNVKSEMRPIDGIFVARPWAITVGGVTTVWVTCSNPVIGVGQRVLPMTSDLLLAQCRDGTRVVEYKLVKVGKDIQQIVAGDVVAVYDTPEAKGSTMYALFSEDGAVALHLRVEDEQEVIPETADDVYRVLAQRGAVRIYAVTPVAAAAAAAAPALAASIPAPAPAPAPTSPYATPEKGKRPVVQEPPLVEQTPQRLMPYSVRRQTEPTRVDYMNAVIADGTHPRGVNIVVLQALPSTPEARQIVVAQLATLRTLLNPTPPKAKAGRRSGSGGGGSSLLNPFDTVVATVSVAKGDSSVAATRYNRDSKTKQVMETTGWGKPSTQFRTASSIWWAVNAVSKKKMAALYWKQESVDSALTISKDMHAAVALNRTYPLGEDSVVVTADRTVFVATIETEGSTLYYVPTAVQQYQIKPEYAVRILVAVGERRTETLYGFSYWVAYQVINRKGGYSPVYIALRAEELLAVLGEYVMPSGSETVAPAPAPSASSSETKSKT
jgi:hypothetical protein